MLKNNSQILCPNFSFLNSVLSVCNVLNRSYFCLVFNTIEMFVSDCSIQWWIRKYIVSIDPYECSLPEQLIPHFSFEEKGGRRKEIPPYSWTSANSTIVFGNAVQYARELLHQRHLEMWWMKDVGWPFFYCHDWQTQKLLLTATTPTTTAFWNFILYTHYPSVYLEWARNKKMYRTVNVWIGLYLWWGRKVQKVPI